MNTYALKHKGLYEYYHRQPEPKASYCNFMARMKRGGTLYENIQPKKKKGPKPKNIALKTGKICNKCGIFKERKDYTKDKASSTGYNSRCRDCLIKAKREYRKRTGGIKDKEYRERKRKLAIGTKIALTKAVYVDGMPREDVYTIIDYKYKKGYLLQSKRTGRYRRLDTGDNGTKNCLDFYKIE